MTLRRCRVLVETLVMSLVLISAGECDEPLEEPFLFNVAGSCSRVPVVPFDLVEPRWEYREVWQQDLQPPLPRDVFYDRVNIVISASDEWPEGLENASRHDLCTPAVTFNSSRKPCQGCQVQARSTGDGIYGWQEVIDVNATEDGCWKGSVSFPPTWELGVSMSCETPCQAMAQVDFQVAPHPSANCTVPSCRCLYCVDAQLCETLKCLDLDFSSTACRYKMGSVPDIYQHSLRPSRQLYVGYFTVDGKCGSRALGTTSSGTDVSVDGERDSTTATTAKPELRNLSNSSNSSTDAETLDNLTTSNKTSTTEEWNAVLGRCRGFKTGAMSWALIQLALFF